jgi:hypothetical protein
MAAYIFIAVAKLSSREAERIKFGGVAGALSKVIGTTPLPIWRDEADHIVMFQFRSDLSASEIISSTKNLLSEGANSTFTFSGSPLKAKDFLMVVEMGAEYDTTDDAAYEALRAFEDEPW